jgi:hypothetical protein
MSAVAARNIQSPQGDSGWDSVQKKFGGEIRTIRQAHLIGKNVGGPCRQGAEDSVRPGYTVNRFVDGAVATGGKHKITAVRDGLPREVTRLAGGLRRVENDVTAGCPEDLNCTV